MTKQCSQCKEIKGVESFNFRNKSQGILMSYCKACYRKYDNARYYRDRKKRLEYIKKRYYKNKEYHYKKTIRYRMKYPEKQIAWRILSYAIRSGKIIKQPCSICGSKLAEAHHPDYKKPLSVVWLCVAHHRETHRKINPLTIEKEYVRNRSN